MEMMINFKWGKLKVEPESTDAEPSNTRIKVEKENGETIRLEAWEARLLAHTLNVLAERMEQKERRQKKKEARHE